MSGAKTLTQGSEWKLILLFTLPIMAGQLLQQLYNTVDGIIVGNFVSEDALSAVGTCTPITMLFIALALGMSTGCSIMISQYFGAGKMDELRRGVSTCIILLVCMGVVLSVVGGVIAKWLLQSVLAADALILADATAYFAIYCCGLLFQFAYNIVSAILRALGDSKATLYFLLISSIANILLDLLFVVVFHWDVPGVAIATVIAQALSAVASFVYMFKKYPMLRFAKGEFRFHRDMGATALRLGIPTTLQQCVISCGHIAIQRLVNGFSITAAYTAGVRIESFVLIPIFSFNAGLATFTGQNLGAGKLARVSRGLKSTLFMAGGICLVLGIFVFFAASALVGLFGLEGDSLSVATQYLKFMGPAFLLFCIYITVNAVLQGAGDVMFTALNSISSLIIRCGFAYFAAYLTPLGVAAVWVSVPVGWVYSLALSTLRYRFGPWRSKGLIQKEEHPV